MSMCNTKEAQQNLKIHDIVWKKIRTFQSEELPHIFDLFNNS